MRLYNQQHRFYAGVDLHARSLFTHVLDHAGRTVFDEDLPAWPKREPSRRCEQRWSGHRGPNPQPALQSGIAIPIADRHLLLFGPYRTPVFKYGDVVICEARGQVEARRRHHIAGRAAASPRRRPPNQLIEFVFRRIGA
jgi:hypothetical protein